MFNRHWVWEESHWPLVGTKLWTNVKVEIHPMKTDAGQMEQSKVALSPSPTESEGVSSKKARQSHGLDVETMKAEIAQWLTGLTSTMVEELSTVKNTLKTQSDRLEGLTAKMGHLEKIVQEGWKEDHRKDGSSADVSDGDKDKEDIGEESRAEAAPPKPARMTTRAKAKDTVSENGNGDISVVVVDKDQTGIDFGSVKKLKQVKKVRAACIVARARSDRQRRLAATHQSPFAGNSTAKVIIPNQPYRGLGYNPFAGVDKPKLSVLIDWLQLDPKWRQRVKGSSSFWFYTLLTPKKWLNDTHMDAGINLLRLRYTKHPEWFRSDRVCFLDATFSQIWTSGYSEFLASPDESGRLLPSGALNYYTGEEPAYCRSDKTWAQEIDDIYTPLFVKGNHWVACWISIPRRHIVIWDSDVSYAKDEEIADHVKPFAHMVPYMLHMMSCGEERELYTGYFTHERVSASEAPQNYQSGDCGVYCLKYIECHALGVAFSPHDLCDKKIKAIRSQLASEIFDETSINGTEKRVFNHLGVYD
ncbi:uncharacterized protein LOC108836870 [Raphanus sativus]|uniref:Uncharacterized protein LOC108836870 n=1 Tax=Raphanus sativus TaxID=3726 RepID=A0A9W3CZR1_RAPSA|nr:uncharacterized protein LOC108836870 [Raphanus sativus]